MEGDQSEPAPTEVEEVKSSASSILKVAKDDEQESSEADASRIMWP